MASMVSPAPRRHATLREHEFSRQFHFPVAWEHPRNLKQGFDFCFLLETVRLHCPRDRYILTAALPVNEAILQCVNLHVLAESLDFLNLMAFDFYGPWAAKSGHHAQLYAMSKGEPSAASGVAYLTSHGFPAKSILLGIPAYGRSFLGATKADQEFAGVGGCDGVFDYCQLPRKGCQETVDRRRIAAQCVGGDGGFVTYDNAETVASKTEFCRQKGLGVCEESTSRRVVPPGPGPLG